MITVHVTRKRTATEVKSARAKVMGAQLKMRGNCIQPQVTCDFVIMMNQLFQTSVYAKSRRIDIICILKCTVTRGHECHIFSSSYCFTHILYLPPSMLEAPLTSRAWPMQLLPLLHLLGDHVMELEPTMQNAISEIEHINTEIFRELSCITMAQAGVESMTDCCCNAQSLCTEIVT